MGPRGPRHCYTYIMSGGADGSQVIRLEPRNVWRIGLVVIGLVFLFLFIRFVVEDGGGVLFTIVMAWFAALAMAPVVAYLSRWMRRGAATLLVILAFALFIVLFILAFGNLLVSQLVQLALAVPTVAEQALAWANTQLGTTYEVQDVLGALNLETADLAVYAGQVALNIVSFVFSLVGSFFGLFVFGLFLFYFSADLPRLQRWVASLFPARGQKFAMDVWRLTSQKTGSYIGARVILAAINSITTAIVFVIIDMPYWLPLALWTGIVAQFVPTIGTYISIILPVLVGLLSPNPWVGVMALAWAIIYQQVENLTIEPRISAKAVDVNPAVGFGAVLLGAALFGVAGAFLAIPVTAMLLALLEIYVKRYELVDELKEEGSE